MVVEPISAVGFAIACSKTAKELAGAIIQLCRDTKTVDSSIEHLAGELRSLATACDLVQQELSPLTGHEAPLDLHVPKNEQLWQSLDNELKACSSLVETLSEIVRKVKHTSIPFGKLGRYTRLSWDAESIDSNRKRVQTRTSTLQTVLLLVNIKVAYIQPARADRELGEKLDILQGMIERLERTTIRQEHTGSAGLKTENKSALLNSAHEILSHGTSLFSASLAGGSMKGKLAARDKVLEWADTLAALRLNSGDSDSSASPSRHSFSSNDRSLAGVMTDETSLPESTGNKESGSGPDVEERLDLALAKAALRAADELFEKDDWKESEASLKLLLSDLQRLSQRQRSEFDLYEVQYKLAICAYHTRNTESAIEALLSLLDVKPATEAHWLYACDVGHRLSLLHLSTNEYEHARISCENAMRTRFHLLGGQHPTCYQSFALLAHINKLMQQEHRARQYMAMIPVAVRQDFAPEVLLADLTVRSRSTDRNSSPSTHGTVQPTVPRFGRRMISLPEDTRPTDRNSSPSTHGTVQPTVPRFGRRMISLPEDTRPTAPLSPRARDFCNAVAQRSMVLRKDHVLDGKMSEPRQTLDSDLEDEKTTTHVPAQRSTEGGEPCTVGTRISDSGKSVPEPSSWRRLPRYLPQAAALTHTAEPQVRKPLAATLEKRRLQPEELIFNNSMARDYGTEEYSLWKQSFQNEQALCSDLDAKRQFAEKVKALSAAAWFGDLQLAETLLLQGVMVDARETKTPALPDDAERTFWWGCRCETWWGPLEWAIGARRLPLIKLFQSQRSLPPEICSLFNSGCLRVRPCRDVQEFIDVLDVLMAAGGAVDAEACNGAGQRLLHLAVSLPDSYEAASITIVEYLLNKGADVMAYDKWGCTPLRLAVIWSLSSVIPALLRHGAQQQLQKKLFNRYQGSLDCLCYAVVRAIGKDAHPPYQTISILLGHRADANAPNEVDSSWLHQIMPRSWWYPRKQTVHNAMMSGEWIEVYKVTPKKLALASGLPELAKLFQNP